MNTIVLHATEGRLYQIVIISIDEHNGAGFMAISKISVMEDKYFDGTELLDEVCLIKLKQWNH